MSSSSNSFSEQRLNTELESGSAPPPSKRRLIWLAVAAVVVASVGGYLLVRHNKAASETAATAASVQVVTATPGSLERTIMVAGATSARNYADVKVPAQRGRGGGDMTLVQLVNGGTEVKKGDVVGVLDPESLQRSIDDYEDTLDQTRARLRQSLATRAVELERLRQSLRSSKSTWDKAAADYKAAPQKTDLEAQLLKLSLDEAEAVYKQQLKSLELQQVSIASDARTQQLSYEQQLSRFARLQSDLKNYTFKAPMDGLAVIQSVQRRGSSDMTQFKVGDQVEAGRAFVKIVDISSMQLQATANQTESSEIRVGQPALVKLDAFPGAEFAGKVYSMGAIAVQAMNIGGAYYVRAVPLVVEIPGRDPRVIPDLSGSAEIKVAYKENVIALPLEALQGEGNGKFVYVKTGKGFEKRPVQTGLKSATKIEITSGVKAGEQVALAKPAIIVN
jgi:multidrug resistance efflux pump